ncbi:transposon Tf2-2 polyprotein [Citrus sinensis]|uniref:Transposon Tf2-2 polyprotein n=1 Tax=Citrus sinensis TaxID=2711 RepID=A0ACB8KCK9_CITSI|nr:transposon Tf2-2 polyprotein [Citrus sinensis]
MASTSSSTPSTHVTLSSTLSLPKSCTSHTANKIENLVEYSYIPESAQITESSYPLLSPYQLYKRPSSFTRSIRTLISTRRPHPKEYIQSSRLDQCSLQAIPAEQYVTLEIPSELISNWKQEGFTHLHLGGIRLILTLHGRKGLPVTARLAMLDTRFKQYQDAVIGTVLTTLHAGSVLLTFYPNFNLSLQDPNLPTTLKVQIQIQGAEQISSAKIATLHYQLVYRLQNHALDLPTPEHHSNTLMVSTIIQLLSESMFERRQDRTVRMTFKPPPSAPQKPPRLSFTYSSMITAVQTAQEDLPITGFNSEGYPVYPAKHNGHFLWDAPGSGMCDPNCPCWDDWEEDDDYATTRKKKPKRKKPPIPCHHCNPKPPSDPPPPPAPLPIYRNELKWIAKHCNSEIPSPLSDPTPIVQPLACMMFSSTSSDYSSSFPPLEPHTDSQRNVVSKPFIPSPITSTGHLEPPKPFESVLNWQTQNARAQNDTLLHLNSKVEHISLRTEQIETKVDSITAQMQYNGPEFDQKEREIRRLKAELAQIESEKQRPTLFTTSPPIPSIGPTYHPFVSILSPIKQYDPSKLFGMTHTLFRDNPLPPPPKPKPRPRPQPRPAPLHPSSLTIPGQPSPTPTPTSPPAPLSVPTQSKDKEPMHQFTAHTVDHSSTTDNQTSDSNLAVSNSPTETDTESSASTSDSEKSYADITKILMAQPDPPTQGQPSHTEPYIDIPSEVKEEMPESSATNQPSPAQPNPPSQKSSNGPWFTFDDLPSHKWRDRLNEMSAWIDLQMLRKRSNNSIKVSSALAVLHDQFLGDPSAVFEAARRDYLNMKCCSLNAKDLDFHYKRMSLLFYKLNGFNEPTLKHVFLASLPEELQPDIQRQLTASNLSLDNISLGKIFQLAKTCLDKLCEQKQFFKELLKDKEPFRNPESPTGSSERNLPPPENSNESNQANVLSAREKATMPKIVPIKDKREKSIRLVEHLQATTDYSPAKDELEFYFSEQDEPNDETLFALQNSSDSDSDQSQVIFHQQLLSLDTTVPIPSIKLQILPSKFQRPIPAIGLIDTGAQRSMLNPHILPSEYWTQSEEHFKAVNGKLFTTSLITKKPIGSHDDHRQLLTQFYDIIQSHGIMLSAKKSTIATDNIEFLGMIIKDGHYQPGKHIAQELLHFPDQQLSKRQIQQFLGIINYIRDFLPHVDHHTHHLSALLKKQPPEWNADHTAAVTTLKQIAQNPPPLKLITDGKRILQTDASDESWGAILLEELNDKEHFIAYASGHFSET